MNTPQLEDFLARIYVDEEMRKRFLADPVGEAVRAGLSQEQCCSLEGIDRTGLRMAARSFAHKRAVKGIDEGCRRGSQAHPPGPIGTSLWNYWKSLFVFLLKRARTLKATAIAEIWHSN